MADSLISDLSKAVGNKLIEEAFLLHGVREEAMKMEQNLKNIEAVLKAAEQREIESDVKVWLSDLKNVAYDIENVLDDWRIAELQMQDESGTSQQGPKFKAKVPFPVVSSPCFCFKQVKSRHHIAHDIKAINEKLGEIEERKNKFDFPTSNIRIIEGPNLESTSAYGNFTVIHSQKDVTAKVIEKLVHGNTEGTAANGNHIPIISLVGMGGIGKTTCARLVYDAEIVKGHFSKTIWVCVSKPFNEMNVAKAIAGGLGLNVTNDSTPHLVLSTIDGFIRGQKFLLVLDNVWEDSEGKWSGILGCLGKGDTQGSRILMTARNSDISKKMGADEVSMQKLSQTDAKLLFSYYAFPRDSDHCGIVNDIAEKLAKKCHRLPLALEVLGRHMATKTSRQEWDDVLTSELWKVKLEERVFNSLAVIYLELPSEAKRCFTFCSFFPNDTIMSKNKLIRLWMAQGYLQGRRVDQMEVLGEECFESLVSRSFFRVIEPSLSEDEDFEVMMHDIIHDFAIYISNGEVANLDPSLAIHDGGVISAKRRHLVLSGEISESSCPYSTFDFKELRTLFLSLNSTAILNELCSKKSYLRALDVIIFSNSKTLNDYDLRDLGKLLHLRYVGLYLRDLTMLPKEICGLPYLQTLDLRKCYELRMLPTELGRLTSLRHLLFHQVDSLPKGLGKLSSLRTLSYFLCNNPANEDCSSLEDLRDLNNLRGEFCLKFLNNVVNVDEATRAQLQKKMQICRLKLIFGDGDASLQSEVLEALQPAKGNLEFLEIDHHKGGRCPQWIGQMQYLKEVRLFDVCIKFLPELGMLCFLEKLFVGFAHAVKHVGAEFIGVVEQDKVFFPALRDLSFQFMDHWEHWEGLDEITRSRAIIMPSLRRLSARSCKALRTLPSFLEHVPLERLKVDSDRMSPVEPVVVDYHPLRLRIGYTLLPQTLKEIDTPFIKLRKVEAVVQLEEASEVAVQQQHLNFNSLEMYASYGLSPGWIVELTNLRQIKLYCVMVECLPSLGSLPFLEELTIKVARNVVKVGDEFLGISSNNKGDHGKGESTATFIVFPRLNKLTFECMPAWREWEDLVHEENILAIMPSLCSLQIENCVKLKSLPHFFKNVPLQRLIVAATEEGDVLKIRNSSSVAEPAACKAINSSTTALAQLDLRDIKMGNVTKEWVFDWAKYCKGLRQLELPYCGAASLAGLELFSSLEFLSISYCYGIKHIGKEFLQMSSLKTLHLSLVSDLEEWEDPPFQLDVSAESIELIRHGNNSSATINFMPSLRILSLWDCPKLKALPSYLRSLPLEQLEIINCPALETWWVNEAGQDWRKWKSTIPKFLFRGTELEGAMKEE